MKADGNRGEYPSAHPSEKGIFLETAHPVKFPEVVEEEIGSKLEIPEGVRPLFEKEKKSIMLDAEYEGFKGWMLKK